MRNTAMDSMRITGKLAAALAALPLLTFGAVVVTTAPESVDNGETAPVEVNVISSAEVAAVRLWFSLAGNSEVSEGYAGNCIALAAGAVAGQYAGVIPRLPAGTLNWYVRVEYANGTYEDSDEKVTTVSSELKRYTRTHAMEGITGLATVTGSHDDYFDSVHGWQQNGGETSSNFFANAVAGATADSQRWKAHCVSWAYVATRSKAVPPPPTSGLSIANLLSKVNLPEPFLFFWNAQPEIRPFVRTPKLDGGLGIFAYTVRNPAALANTLEVQVSYADNPGDSDADWTRLGDVFSMPAQRNDFFRTNVSNNARIRYVRIVRTSNNTGNIINGVIPIDNIMASPAQPEIALFDGERSPAAPVTGKEIAIQCLVSNILAQTPAFNKSVKVHYAFAASESASVSSWSQIAMAYAGETNGCALFTATLPSQLEAGYYHYYYECDFDGYFYGSKAQSGFSGTRYLYGGETTAVAPAAAPPHLTIHVPEREYKVSIVSAPSSLSESHTGTIVALHTGDQAPMSVKLYFSLENSPFVSSAWNSIVMTPGGNAGEYTATLPLLPPGTLSWYVEVEYDDAESEPSKLQSTTINQDFDYTRYHDMKGTTGLISATTASYYDNDYGWRHEGGNTTGNTSTNFYANAVAGTELDSQRWIASGVGWGVRNNRPNNTPQLKPLTIQELYNNTALTVPILYFKNLPIEEHPPFIRTPLLTGGAGRVSFNAHNQYGTENQVKVQVCYTDTPNNEECWIDREIFIFDTAKKDFLNQSVVINDLSVKYVRIVRSNYVSGESLDYGVIGIDDFLVTPASPDVSLAERFRNPGYPAVGQDITLQCAVSNISEVTPALNISVMARYALGSTADSAISSSQWRSVPMDLKSSENGVSVFECQVPAQSNSGWLHYYFQCTFDGYCHGSKIPGATDYNGWNSPEYLYLDTDATTNAPPLPAPPHLNFEVRPFRSRYSTVKLRTDSGDGQPVLTDMILNGDNQWQASIPVKAGATVNAYFVGHDLYEDGAAGFASYLRYYGDNDQEYLTTPSGGTAETKDAVTNTLSGVAITTDKDGFLLYNLDDSDNGATYTVRKGFYQDFNSWVVNGDYYVESHAGMTIGERTENFEGWKSSTENTDTPFEDFQLETAVSRDAPPNLGTDFTIGGVGALYDETWKGWELSAARISCERITNYTATVINPVTLSAPYSNNVAQIKEGGGFQSTLDDNSLAHGLGTISAVMRSAIGDNVKAVLDPSTYSWACSYQNSDWTTNKAIFIEASFEIPPKESPNNHYYVSVLFDYQNENNFYEVRYKRNDTNSGNAKDNRARVEIRRTINGTDAGLAGWDVTSDQVMNGSTVLIKIRQRRSGNNQMQTHVGLMVGTHNYWGSYNAQNTDNTPGVLVNGGGVAICAYDCAPKVNFLKVYGGGTEGKVYDAAKSSLSDAHDKTFDPAEWSLGSAARPEWYVDGDLALRRRIPEMSVQLYVKAADNAVQYHTGDLVETFAVTSLTYKTFSYPVHSPESKMFRFVVNEADGNYIVLDKVSGTHWRAANRSNSEQEGKHGNVECYKWTDASTQQTPWMRADNQMFKWLILEGWAKTNSASGTFTAAAFQKSQAHPDLVQGLVSPVMTNGIGSVMFNYRVSGDGVSSGKVVYAIEYTNPLGTADNPDFDGAVTAAVVTNTLGAASGNSGSKTFDINENYGENAGGDNINMRLRIRIIPEETDPDVILWLDEVVVKDYPKADDDTWEVYNGRIADADAEPTAVYGGAGKTLFLNNSQTSGLAPRANPFTEKRPCVQSPRLDTGIGEIAFSYRALTSTAQGRFTVAISDDASQPDENWTEIASITVSDSSGYVSFDNMSIHKRDKYFVRIFSETNGLGRVCIDNILVAEPIDPTFEINSVTLVPKQPVLSTTNLVSVRASVANRRLNPRNIRLFATYHEGSNVWGVSNWCEWGTDTAVELFPDSTGTNYSSAAGTGLPQDVQNNGVVQYVVWGFAENSPEGDRILENEGCFTPPTGLPNLNELYTNSIPGATWSPYYFVMESPVGVVWFNEVWIGRGNNETYPGGGTPYEFIELAGQPGAKIGGWRIDVYTKTSPTFGEPTYSFNINPGSTLGNNGIWVIGDEGTPNANQIAVDSSGNNTKPGIGKRDMFRSGFPRELVLVRNNETIECAVYAKNTGTAASGPFPYGGEMDGIPSVYISSPLKGTTAETGFGYSYALLNQQFDLGESYDETQNTAWTSGFYGTTWYWTAGMPSPGEPNWSQRPDGSGRAYQTLPGGGVVPASLRLVSKIIGAAFGTQNGAVTDIDIDVESVGSTSIVYVANSWYKINALVSGNSEVGAASGATAYTFSISANSMSGDVTNYVYFTEKTAADYASNPEGTRWTKAILDWFRANDWSEGDIAADDGDDWTVWDEFLLNTDPTLHTEVECRTSSFAIADDIATLGLYLERTEGGGTVYRPLNGAVNIYGVADLADLAAGAAKVSSCGKGLFDGTTGETGSFSLDGLDLNFFIWKIEAE